MTLYAFETNVIGPVTLRRTMFEIPSPVFCYRNQRDASTRSVASRRDVRNSKQYSRDR